MSSKKVVFRSLRFKLLRIVLDPKAKKEVMGQLVTTSLTNRFKNHPHGVTVEFENGFYETDDEEIIEALKSHEDYGSMFDSTDTVVIEKSDAAKGRESERTVVTGAVASTDPTCTVCGEKMKNAKGLEIHMRSHK